jgi:peroxiredoxin
MYGKNRLELDLIFTIGHTDDGDSGGRNVLLKNNMRLKIMIKAHLLVCHKSIKHFNKWACSTKFMAITLLPPDLTFSNSTFCPHSVFMRFVWISEQTAIISLYNIN